MRAAQAAVGGAQRGQQRRGAARQLGLVLRQAQGGFQIDRQVFVAGARGALRQLLQLAAVAGHVGHARVQRGQAGGGVAHGIVGLAGHGARLGRLLAGFGVLTGQRLLHAADALPQQDRHGERHQRHRPAGDHGGLHAQAVWWGDVRRRRCGGDVGGPISSAISGPVGGARRLGRRLGCGDNGGARFWRRGQPRGRRGLVGIRRHAAILSRRPPPPAWGVRHAPRQTRRRGRLRRCAGAWQSRGRPASPAPAGIAEDGPRPANC